MWWIRQDLQSLNHNWMFFWKICSTSILILVQEFLDKMTCAVQEVGLGDDSGTFWSNWCPLGAWGVISVNPTLCLSPVFNSVLTYMETIHIAVAAKTIWMQNSNPLRAACCWDGWEQSPEQYNEGEVGMGRRANQPGCLLPWEEPCYNITITMIFGCRKLWSFKVQLCWWKRSLLSARGYRPCPALKVLPILPQATSAGSVQLD